MKLFLSSLSISKEQEKDFFNLVGKEAKDISIALIENAADPYKESEKGFVLKTRQNILSKNMQVEIVDLTDFIGKTQELYQELARFDVIWCGGGNTFYLRWLFKECGFDLIIHQLLEKGIVYGGGSAGAIVVGPSLEKYDLVDSVDKSPIVITAGLGLTNFVIIPHWGTKKYQNLLNKIEQHYIEKGIPIVTLTDEEAIIIIASERKIIPKNL